MDIELPALSLAEDHEAVALSRAIADALIPLLRGHTCAVVYEASSIAFCGALAATWPVPAERDAMFDAYVRRARGIFATVDRMRLWNG
jgi:hypothetical protein